MEQAVRDLTGMFVTVQHEADYEKAKEFLETYGSLDNQAQRVLKSLNRIPVDIRPIYPRKI